MLSDHHRWLLALGWLLIVACSAEPDPGVGGQSGGSSATSGGSEGGASADGGSTTTTGGGVNRGGADNAGGASTTGGSASNSGGPGAGGVAAGGSSGGPKSTGGAGGAGSANGGSSTSGGSKSTGGSPSSGGSKAAGGVSNTGGSATSGASSGGAAGACVPATCGTHKWACWHMPNPAGSGLPNEASYTDLANGIVRDNVTCLEWEKTPATSAADTANWDGALAYCANLAAGGYSDWRVPTRVELASIVDFTKSPAINRTAFPNAKSGYHRTSSDWILDIKQIGAGAGKDFAWIYNMGSGLTSNAYSRASSAEVRCVRGNGNGEAPTAAAVAPPNQYTQVAAGEVQDNYTGLIWQAGTSDATMEFSAAKGYCADLSLNGHAWRVPSLTELSTLVDEAEVGPAINRAMFPGTKSGKGIFYWASHAYVSNAAQGWGLNFDDGFTGYNSGAAGAWNSFPSSWVRCVR